LSSDSPTRATREGAGPGGGRAGAGRDPGAALAVRANRAFLARATRFLAGEAGIGQFLDLGTGIPGTGNTHEVAQQVAPRARVVYVDNDRCKSGCAHA
jgi:hypothetical protein